MRLWRKSCECEWEGGLELRGGEGAVFGGGSLIPKVDRYLRYLVLGGGFIDVYVMVL